MAAFCFTNGMFMVNGTDYSSFVRSVTVNYQSELLDKTTMGSTTRVRMGGPLVWSMDVEFNEDVAAAGIDHTFWDLVGTTACVETAPLNSCATEINPRYGGVAVLEKWPFGGSWGTLASVSTSFASAGVLARSTATA